ncbi:MAG: DoxX family protein [Myxococcales bacterium]
MDLLKKSLSVRERLLGIAGRLEWLPLFLIRASLAAVFIPSGWGKLHDLGKVSEFFTELGIPAPHLNAVVVAVSELGCGTLLLIGILSRVAAIPLIVSMTIAIITAKRADISGITALFAVDEFIYIVMSIAVIVLGAGTVSIDGQIGRQLARRKADRS